MLVKKHLFFMSRKPYPYTLVPYTSRKSRSVCPACKRPHCYSRFVDVRTGELLPEQYGRCDHEVSCSYFVSPYRAEAGGMSYAKQMKLGEKPVISLPPLASTYVRPTPAKVVCIPETVYQQSMRLYEKNAFAKLLRHHFGCEMERELLCKFHVGTSKYWPGACVFWLIDERGRIRSGQVVQFDESGHTVREPERRTTWVHSAMTRSLQRTKKPLPDWLLEYNNSKAGYTCLFGLHLLATYPVSRPVALVESPKAAIIADAYYPQFIWMATSGKQNLTAERLEPLRGRRIVLWPDVGGYEDWQKRAADLRKMGFTIRISNFLEKVAANERGLDLADVLLREWLGYPPSWGIEKP